MQKKISFLIIEKVFKKYRKCPALVDTTVWLLSFPDRPDDSHGGRIRPDGGVLQVQDPPGDEEGQGEEVQPAHEDVSRGALAFPLPWGGGEGESQAALPNSQPTVS